MQYCPRDSIENSGPPQTHYLKERALRRDQFQADGKAQVTMAACYPSSQQTWFSTKDLDHSCNQTWI